MNKITLLKIGTGLALRYVNLRYRKMTNEERYEGYMRSDFSSRMIKDYDFVQVVRI